MDDDRLEKEVAARADSVKRKSSGEWNRMDWMDAIESSLEDLQRPWLRLYRPVVDPRLRPAQVVGALMPRYAEDERTWWWLRERQKRVELCPNLALVLLQMAIADRLDQQKLMPLPKGAWE